MSTEQMRQEFEAWYCDSSTGPCMHRSWMGFDGLLNMYERYDIQDAWLAWQASRAAVVVELPEDRIARGYGEQVADALGFNDGVGYCRAAIEAAGLKVKP